MKTALITGAFGQDGYFLTKKLIDLGGYNIICTSHSFKQKLDSIYKYKNVVMELLDIRNEFAIFNLIKKYQPDELYHLASFSAPILSWENPKEVISINGNSTICFLDAVRLFSIKTKFFFPSSGKIFGKPSDSPQTENTAVDPQDPYSLGKYIGHQTVKLYRKKYKIFACNGILYNHESHLKNINFVTYKICHFAKLIKKGEIDSFSLLNTEAEIDLGDPRDYVDAMYLILQQKTADDFIISMNASISIKEICLKVGKMLEIPDMLSHIAVQDGKSKINSVKLQGNNSKLKSIGWTPKYNIEETLKLMLDKN